MKTHLKNIFIHQKSQKENLTSMTFLKFRLTDDCLTKYLAN